MVIQSDFIFGVGTSAVQTEEQITNDWSGLRAKDNSIVSNNIEHLKHWQEDYAFLKELGVNAFKTSIDWARLQQSEHAELEKSVLRQYKRMFRYLKNNGIDIYLTLHHFANPEWFTKMGGWSNPSSPSIFLDFARKATHEFSEFTNNVITINEPSTYISLAYGSGFLPPHGKSFHSLANGFSKVAHNMAFAHRKAYTAIKEKYGESKMVSFSEVQRPFVPFEYNTLDIIGAGVINYLVNNYIWNIMMTDNCFADFIGMNYYGPWAFDASDKHNHLKKRPFKDGDALWEIDPVMMITLAEKLHRKYHLPVIITENGTGTLADNDDDNLRSRNIRKHLEAIARSKEDFIKGYFHWSLLDNFELDKGFSIKMGLVDVDLKTMKRTPKNSFYDYKKLIMKYKEK